MGSSSKRSAKQSARATGPAPAQTRARAPIRGNAKAVGKSAAPARPRAAKAQPRPTPFPLRAVLEQLEPRLLMSADLNPLATDALFATPTPASGSEFRALTDPGHPSAVIAAAVAPIQRTHELVFVDPRVPDRDQLLAGLTGQSADGRRFEVIVLDPTRDGIAQVTAALAERIQVDAVHFVSHGTDGAVQLGATWLDAKTLGANTDAVAGWGASLKEDADILFYGCDLAATARGRALVDWLAELTKADVAASTDATGNAKLGGDWTLEYRRGQIDATAAADALMQADWQGLLAGTYYLGGDTTPPFSALEAAAPTDATWDGDNNYDPGRDAFAGLVIKKDNAAPDQSDDTKHHTWTALAPAGGIAIINEQVTLSMWSAMKDNDPSKRGTVTAYLMDMANATATNGRVIAQGTIPLQPWSGSFNEYTLDFGVLNDTVAAGRYLAVKVVVGNTSDDDLWFAYDAVAYPSRLQIGASNVSPVANDVVANGNEDDVSIAVTLTGSDLEGPIASVRLASLPANGTLYTDPSLTTLATVGPSYAAAGNALALYFVPAPNWNGSTTFQFTATDGGGLDDATPATATINVAAANDAPVVGTLAGDVRGYVEGDPATVIDAGTAATVTDVDSADFTGGALTVSFTAGSDPADDVLAIRNQGTGAGQIGVAGATVTYGGVAIGTFAGGTGGANLLVTFNASATPAAAQVLLRNITFANTDLDAPTPGARTVQFVLTDGDGGTSGAVAATVNVAAVNDPPVANDVVANGNEDTSQIAITLTGSDIDGPIASFRIVGALPPNGTLYTDPGLATLAASATNYAASGNALTLYFVPAANWNGTTAFQFTATDGGGLADATPATATINVAPVNDAPAGTVVVIGTAQEDQILTADTSTVADPEGLGIFAYQWGRSSDGGLSWTNIGGATGQNYTLGDSDVGKLVRVSVAYVDGGGTPEVVTSAGIGPVLGIPDDTLIVDTTSDAADGDTSSIDALLANKGLDGFVSLREAIIATNSTANFSGPDRILFDIAGAGPHTIVVLSALPSITDAVVIDGSSEPDFAGTPVIELNGAGAGAGTGTDGLLIAATADGSIVRGFVINRFDGDGLHVEGDNTIIVGNYIGTDASGGSTVAGNSGYGIHLRSDFNRVGGTGTGEHNVISANLNDGVFVDGSSGNVIVGNHIGTNAAGTAPLGNAGHGVEISGGATNNTVGGTVANARNIISGNTLAGIWLDGASTTGNVVLGNYVGLDAAGTIAIGNDQSGIWMSGASGNTIGGIAPGARNVISGNLVDGITGIGSSDNLIQSNYVGTDASGSFAIGNGEDGVYLQDGSNNTVGGTTAAARNVLSGNGWSGLTFFGTGSDNVAQGNYIGTNAAGTGPLGNLEQGVLIATPGPTTIGGTVPGTGNVIAYNGWDGVEVSAGTRHSVLGNSIYQNGDLGIDLGAVLSGDGSTPNDPGDGDTGTNNLQNFPVLTGAATNGTTVTIAGSLDSLSFFAPGYRVEFFANGASGQRYLGFTTVPIGAAGTATFSATLTAAVALGETVTATATGPDGSTSEFSAGVTATAGSTISGTIFHDVNGNANVTDDAGAVFANTIGAVRLHLDDGDGVIDSGDSFVSIVDTNAAGGYTFTGLAAGNYYVVVNSRALGAPNVWAEQTYAVAGAARAAAFTSTSGALYGGRDVAASDNALGSINTAEHVNRVAVAGTNVAGVDYGFSFNAIVNDRGDTLDDDTSNARQQQGTLRQFILNANALAGPQTANFSINFAGGGGPQTINVTGSALPTILGPVILDAAATQEGFSGIPIIQLNGAGAGGNGLAVTGGGSTVRGFAINRFQTGVSLSGIGGNTIAGNYIGTDLAGSSDRGNTQYGIRISSSGNTIGGLTLADRNVVSGNDIDGIWVSGANDNLIRGNYIGTDATGMFGIANNEDGIWLDGSSGNTVGGTTAAERNTISGNGWSGIDVSSGGSGNVIQGNHIGINAFGGALGNLNDGVRIRDGIGHRVGGTASGAGNLIAHNFLRGVAIDSGSGHSVLGNSIYSNGGIGIDLDGDSVVTFNDAVPGDPDGGANGRQNYPVLALATTAGTQITITGTLNSTPGSTFRIEFFASPSPGDPSGYGEGERYLGSITTPPTDASGNVAFTSPAFTAAVAAGERIGATATDLTSGDTSEFSAHIAATGPNPVLDLDADNSSGATGSGYQATFTENGPPVTIADSLDAMLTDPDSATLAGMTVTITNLLDGGAESLSAATGGTGIVATYAGGVLTLSGADTVANYQQVLRTVAYRNASDNPSTVARVITFVATDGSNASNSATATVTVLAANDPPAGANNTVTSNEDVPYTFAAGDFGLADPDIGDSLSAVRIDTFSLPLGATLRLAGVDVNPLDLVPVAAITAGNLVFTPAPNANGTGYASFTFSVRDQALAFDPAPKTMTVDVTAVDDLPGASNDAYVTNEDTPLVVPAATGVLANDIGLGDGPLALSVVGVPVGGAVALNNDGSFTFTPAADFNGAASFVYQITDADGDTSTATVTINVAPLDDVPVATDDTYAATEDTVVNVPALTGVLANDAALGDGPLTLSVVGVPVGGTVLLNNDGSFTFTPAADFNGPASFVYQITDADGDTTTATVDIAVNPVNDTPVANNDVYAALEDTPLVFGAPGVLANDAGVGDGPLTLSVVGPVTGGSVVLNNDGSFTFTPTTNFTGTASFVYQVQDADGETSTATVDITVSAVNDAPVLDLDANNSSGALGADYVRTFTEGGSPARVADTDATLTDNDSPTLASVTITITNLLDGAAELLTANLGATGIVANYAGGGLTLSGGSTVADYEQVLRTVTYENTSDAPSTAQRVITVVVNDGVSSSNVGTARVTIAAVNDAPIADIAPASYAATENVPLALQGTGLSVADIDALPASIVTVYLDSISGLLSATAGTTGVTVAGSGSPSLTLTGTLAQINSLLAGGGGATMTYNVGSDSPFPTDTLSLSINDNGATGAGGAQWGWDSATVNLTAVNDAPLITIPGTASTPEDTSLVFSTGGGNLISITDVDAAGAPVRVTLNVSTGLISLAGTAGLAFTSGDGTADASMTFTGTVAAINAALDGLVFAPPADYNGSAFLSVSVDDQGNSGTGGSLTDADFSTITVTGVNDAPAGTDATVATPQDTPYTLRVANFGFTDADAGDTLAAVRIDALPGAGSFTLSGVAVTAGQLIAVADINAGNLVFTPALGATGVPYASFTFSVRDSGGAFDAAPNALTVNVATPANNPPTGTDGAVTTAPSTDYVFTLSDFGYNDPDAGDALSAVRIDSLPSPLVGTLYYNGLPLLVPGQVVPVGDLIAGDLVFRPVLLLTGTTTFDFSVRDTNGPDFDVVPNTMTVTVAVPTNDPVNVVPGAQVVNEDTLTAIGGIAVNDPNGDLDTVQLAVGNGTITVSLTGGATIVGGANGSSTLTLDGTGAQINAALATVSYQGNLNFSGADILTITSTDLTLLQDVDSVAITVNPVNDAPVATAPAGYATTEQVVLTLHGTGLTVADVDAGSNSVTATLSAITGAVFVNPGASGVIVSGSGTPLVTLVGNVGAINTLLAGSGGGTVTYLVTTDSPPASDMLTLTINDGGASGAGGPRSASASSTIAIGAVNDAPVNTLPGGSTTLEDNVVVFSAAGGNQISITDVDAGGAPVEARLNASNGVITLGGIGGLTFITGDGASDPSMRFTGTLSAINAALNGLVFTPNLDYNGLAFIQLTTNDLGASGSEVPPAPRSDTDLATIDVLPVNDAPNGTDTTVTLNEDSAYPFSAGDFGFTDVDSVDAMTAVRIDTIALPGGATLQLAGANVTPGQVITVVEINAGLLVFTPAPDANGASYASFTFSVRDTGVPPGPLFDAVPNTMTVDVTPVNDLPGITSDGGGATAALVVAENTTAVTTATATDIDLQPLTFSLAGVDAARFSIDSVTGVLTFNAAPNFETPADAGGDNVYNVTVRVSDGAGGVDNQALTITVTDANDAPTASGDAYVTDEELPLSIAATGVLGNDGDEDGTPVAAVLVAGPANGSVTFNADGSFVYTPNVNFFGVDTFTYQATDGALGSATATVTITVNPINDAPSAADGNVTIAAAYAFSAANFNYFDVDGDPLVRIMITALPVEGQLLFDGVAVTLNQEVTAAELAAGRLTYVPPTTTATAASFAFSVSDGTLYEAASHTMTVGFASGAVLPPPPPPPPPTITPPPAPPAEPPAEPPPAEGAPAEPSGDAPTGGGRGGGGGGGAGGDTAAPPAPPATEGAAAAETAQAAAGVVATTAQSIAGAAPTGSIGFQSGGVAPNPGAAAPANPLESRGEPPAGEAKAEMETVAAMAAPEVRQALDEARERVQEEAKVEARVAGSVFVVSTGLSVGYVLWLLRGGALIASLLSSLPAWRLVDPLPVLGSMGGRAGEEDDDSLEDLVADDRQAPSAPGQDELADNDNVGSVRT